MKALACAILIILVACDSSSNSASKTQKKLNPHQTSSCSKLIRIDTLRQNLISLNYNEFDTLLIQDLFKDPWEYNLIKAYPNESSFICRFNTRGSEVIIATQGYHLPFYLDYAKITDNSIYLNYGIEIGMNREAFFNNIKQPLVKCDSIKISEIGSMSLFVFEDDKLKKIILTTTI